MKLVLDTAQLTADLVWLTTVAKRWFVPDKFTPAEQDRLARLCLAGVLDVTPMVFYKPATGRKVRVTFRQEPTTP